MSSNAKSTMGNPVIVKKYGLLETFKEEKFILALVLKENYNTIDTLSEQVQQLLVEFHDICSNDFPPSIPPLTQIQHHIDFILNESLPNLPHYSLNLK